MKTGLFASAFLAFILCGCIEERPAEMEDTPPADNFLNDMPEQAQDMLLGPLESVSDDLKASIDMDPSLALDTIPFASNRGNGAFYIKLYDNDFARIEFEASSDCEEYEHHYWYFDRQGNVFYSQHELSSVAMEGSKNQQHYKFYFDENGARLSSYARLSYNGNTLPVNWESVKLPTDLQEYLKSKYLQIQ